MTKFSHAEEQQGLYLSMTSPGETLSTTWWEIQSSQESWLQLFSTQTTWLEDARQHSNSNMVIMLIGNKRSGNRFHPILIVNTQWLGSTPRREEGGGWGVCKRTWPRLHGNLSQDCCQRGGGLHQHSQGDLRQDPGGRLRHQQWGERDQVGTSAQPCWRGSCRSRGSVWEFGGLLLNFCKSTMTTLAEIGRPQSCFWRGSWRQELSVCMWTIEQSWADIKCQPSSDPNLDIVNKWLQSMA